MCSNTNKKQQKMTLISRIFIAFALILFVGCSNDDDGTPTGGGGDDGQGVTPTATYELTFTPNFTEEDFPTDYPSNATFGPILAIAHPADVSVFRIGQVATDAFKAYTEDGDADTLASALTQGVEGMEVTTMIVAGGSTGPTTTDVTSINVSPSNTRITFLAKLNPSPDWFVGVDAFDVIAPDGISLVQSEEISLVPLDAGTDAGTTYNSDNEPSNGQTISVINDAPFGTGGLTPALGVLSLRRTN